MNKDNSQLHHCAGLLINCQTGEVSNQKQQIRLSPVNARVLAVLLKNASTAVSRQQLFDAVWPNQVISDDALTRCISDLRAQLKALTAVEPLIETIPKVGYRWLPVVEKTNNKSMVQLPEKKWPWSLHFKPMLVALALFVVLVWGLLGLLYFGSKSNTISMIILPTQIVQDAVKSTPFIPNDDVADWLKLAVMQHDDMQYIADYALQSHAGNPFPYFSHEFGVRWFIESEITLMAAQKTLTLNLIDAKTALVIYSQQHPFVQWDELTTHCYNFVDFIAQL